MQATRLRIRKLHQLRGCRIIAFHLEAAATLSMILCGMRVQDNQKGCSAALYSQLVHQGVLAQGCHLLGSTCKSTNVERVGCLEAMCRFFATFLFCNSACNPEEKDEGAFRAKLRNLLVEVDMPRSPDSSFGRL